MASIIALIVLLLATLTLGGCGALPSGYGYGYGNASGGYGGGGAYPQAYGGGIPIPVPVDPGYGGGYAASGAYAPQGQPYCGPQGYGQPYAYGYNGAEGYDSQGGPQYSDYPGSRRIDRREREEAARIRQGVRDGSITPQEARRLWAEQRHIRGAEARMKGDGNLDPRERARLNGMLNHGNRDIYQARHNDRVQPDGSRAVAQPNHRTRHNDGGQFGGPGPVAQPNNGPMVRPNHSRPQPENGAVGPMARPGSGGAHQMQAPMQQPQFRQPQARSMQPQVRPMQSGPRVQPGGNTRFRRIATSE